VRQRRRGGAGSTRGWSCRGREGREGGGAKLEFSFDEPWWALDEFIDDSFLFS
jgi:hypothetical protein